MVRIPILLKMKHKFREGKNVSDKNRISHVTQQQLWNLGLGCQVPY